MKDAKPVNVIGNLNSGLKCTEVSDLVFQLNCH